MVNMSRLIGTHLPIGGPVGAPKLEYHFLFGTYHDPFVIVKRRRTAEEIQTIEATHARYGINEPVRAFNKEVKIIKRKTGGIMTLKGPGNMLIPVIAKTSRAHCPICDRQIMKGEVKITYRTKISFRSGEKYRGGTYCIQCHYKGLLDQYAAVRKYMRAVKRQASKPVLVLTPSAISAVNERSKQTPESIPKEPGNAEQAFQEGDTGETKTE